MSIHPYRPNALTGSPLDRAGYRRTDETWVRSQIEDPATQFLPVWRSRTLVRIESTAARAALLTREALNGVWRENAIWAFLGELDGAPVFAIDLSALDEPPSGGFQYQDLRRMGGQVAPEDAALMAHARGLMHWRTRHRFCGVCGAPCLPGSAGHVMHCQGCGTHHFPRTDPAVIMLVTRGDRALLGHPAAFRDRRVFTTLAGFVEPGESLEEAVAREVWEETGIRCVRARYHSSQPWPFPASIMLGFRAEAETEEITIDPSEIVEARWFTRDEVRSPADFVLPPDFSIARRLINDWLNG